VLEGDRFEFAPDQSYPRMACITDAPLLAQGVTSFTIVSEVTEEAPVPEPRLQIERTPTGLVVSWPYLGWFYAVMRTNIASEPTEYFAPLYRDFTSYFELSPTNDAGFISLRHYFYYYSRPWNTD